MTMTKFSRINKQREEITMRVLEDMEKGGNEWKKPWVEASPLPPHNPVSGTQYSGRNFLYTYVYGMMRGYADPRWATEKQIKEMGWKVPENLQNGRGGINDELGVTCPETWLPKARSPLPITIATRTTMTYSTVPAPCSVIQRSMSLEIFLSRFPITPHLSIDRILPNISIVE